MGSTVVFSAVSSESRISEMGKICSIKSAFVSVPTRLRYSPNCRQSHLSP